MTLQPDTIPSIRHTLPPELRRALMGRIANRDVTFDLRSLASVLTMLVPRTQVA